MHTLLLLLLACNGKTADDTSGHHHHHDDTGGGGGGGDDTGGEDTPDAAIRAAIRAAVLSDLDGARASGASVAVWVDGEIRYAEGFGSRHPDRDEPVETSTLFQIGSDTKKLTALAALQQVEAGRLSLDTTLAEVVPELSFALDADLAGELTLHELLSHQGALYDYTPWTQSPDDAELYDRSVGRFAENEYTLGPSGLFWNYANPNFSLAGLMTQQADGRMWADILEDDLFAPLGMDRSFVRLADVVADGDHAAGSGFSFPDGYDTFDPLGETPPYVMGTVEAVDLDDDAFTRPAGLVWSTASDMARLAGFLMEGDESVLSDALRQQVLTPHVPLYPASDATDLGYGYGLMINNFGFSGLGGFYADVPLWTHGGNTLAMTSTFFVLPEQGVAVAILSNGYADDFTLSAVTALEAFAALPTPGTAETFLQEPENVEALAGEWFDPHALGRLTLTWDGTDLLVSAPDLEALGATVGSKLRPYVRDLYLLRVDGQDYDFALFEDGEGGAWLINRTFSWERGAPPTQSIAPPSTSAATARFHGVSLPDPRLPAARLLGLPSITQD